MKYRWVHLSDIHYAYINYQTNRLRERLFEKLREISRQDKVNFLFITGDITDIGSEYSTDLYKFIGDVREILEIDEKHLFLVPGNHDVNRKIEERKEVLDKIKRYKDKGFEFIETMADNTLKLMISAQERYFDLYQRIIKEEYPVNLIHYIREADGAKIIHFNTALLCGMKGEEGRLFLGTNILHNSLKEAKLKEEELNIAIGHHSFECFHKREKEQLTAFFKEYNIDFYLSGHVHEALINYNNHIDTHFCVCRQMRSDDYQTGGLAIGNIDTISGQNKIEFHAWNRKGYWTWDTDVGYEAPYGVYNFNTSKFSAVKYREKPVVIVHKLMNTPVNQQKLLFDMGLTNAPVYHYQYSNIEINTEDEWEEHKLNTENFMSEVIARLQNNVVHIFSLSQIPLLIQMGYILQNDNDNIKIYQLDENQKWVLGSEAAQIVTVKTEFTKNHSETKKLIIILAISSTIDTDDIDVHIKTEGNSVLKITTIDKPSRYTILYESQVKYIKNVFRREAEKYINEYNEVHIFVATPAGLSIELGRCILKSMWPKVYLYNYRRYKDPKYQFAFTLN